MYIGTDACIGGDGMRVAPPSRGYYDPSPSSRKLQMAVAPANVSAFVGTCAMGYEGRNIYACKYICIYIYTYMNT
jgi:hypothetical protein